MPGEISYAARCLQNDLCRQRHLGRPVNGRLSRRSDRRDQEARDENRFCVRVRGYPANAVTKDYWGKEYEVLLSCSIFIAVSTMKNGEKMVCSFEISAMALKTEIGKKVD